MTRNLLYSGISTLTNFFLFILLIFVGRELGVQEYGIFTFALAFVTMFELLTDFGLRDISVRNVARNKALTEKYIGNIIIWKLLLCVVIYMIIIIVMNILQYDSRTKLVVYILALSSFLKSFKQSFRIFFQVHDRFDLDTLLVCVERFSLLIICMMALIFWKQLIIFALFFTGVRLLDFIITLLVLKRKIISFKLQFDFNFMKQLQMEAVPLGTFYFVLVILSSISTVMLSKMCGFREVGLYNAAFQIYEGVTILPTIFYAVILPRLSELYTTEPQHHRQLSIDVVKYMFVIALPLVTYGIVLSQFFIQKFFEADFIEAVLALQILFFGIAFQFPNWMLNTILISINKQKKILYFGFIGLLLNIILNLILIPRFTYEGAAVATVLAEALMFLCAIVYLYRHYVRIPLMNVIVKPVLATGIIAVIFLTIHISTILLILLSTVFYCLMIYLLKVFDKQELRKFMDSLITMFGSKTSVPSTFSD